MSSTDAPTLVTFRATWWHRESFWTSGTLQAPTAEDARDSIIRIGGSKIMVDTMDGRSVLGGPERRTF